jgi:hypothetical protein
MSAWVSPSSRRRRRSRGPMKIERALAVVVMATGLAM